ncbi:MAG: hypothetical protein ACRDON_12510 [Gaiellaceae bacterium]
METSLARRLFLRTLIASLCVTAGLAIITLLAGDFDETAGRILATTAFVSLYSLMGLPGGVLLDQGRARILAWVLVSLASVSFLLAMGAVWGGGDDLWKPLVVTSAFAGACAQIAAATSRRRETDGRAVDRLYLASIVLGFALAGLISYAAVAEVDGGGYYRLLGAVAVANVLSALLQPIVRRMAPAAPPAEGASPRLILTLDRLPPQEAIEEVVATLVRHGSTVERVERQS